MIWRLPDRILTFDRPLVMGILNLTPDSFSDGGKYYKNGCIDADAAVAAAADMERAGADVIDVGAESTRPGCTPLSGEEEWARLEPLFAAVGGKVSVPISIDTYHPETAARAVAAGAQIINDVTGFSDPDMLAVAAETQAAIILMHCADISDKPDAVGEVRSFFAGFDPVARKYGIPAEKIMLDVGVGFGKSMEQNLELIRRCGATRVNGRPILVGASRKRVIEHFCGKLPPDERDAGTVAAHNLAILSGANMIRTHLIPDA